MPIREIRVYEEESDPLAHKVERQAAQQGQVVELETDRVFYVEDVTDEEAERLATELFSNPVTQRVDISQRTDWDNPRLVEVAPQPGFTNPERASMQYGAHLLGVEPTAVDSGHEYLFSSDTPEEARTTVVGTILVNKTVEQVRPQPPETLVIGGREGTIKQVSTRDLPDDELLKLSKTRVLALNLKEMQSIQSEARRLGREMYDGEIKYLGTAWSEHCCHKTTNAEVITPTGVKRSVYGRIQDCSKPYFGEREVLSAFSDNSGVFRFYDGYAINIKLETHNSPRQTEPRGGAETGTGGVLRDVNETGLGAKPINSMHMDFVGPLDMTQDDVPPGSLTPRQLLTGSVEGVGRYGNPVGVPTNNGSVHTHPNYIGKGSILVGSMGRLLEKDAFEGHPQPGDLVVAVGGRTGRDGIDGATMSSMAATGETATVHSGAVQIGDPITEKKMFDAIMEASERGLIRAMTDCGAAGFASAIGELGEDIGVTVDLARAPLKYSGLEPWQIFVSESQERAVLAIDPANVDEIIAIFAKHESEATVLGVFGSPGEVPKLEVSYNGESLVDLEYEFIKNGRGSEPMRANWWPNLIEERRPETSDWVTAMEAVLSDWNVCSKEDITRRYDQEVQGMSAMKSYAGVHNDAPNNAAVLTPIPGKPYAVVQAHGCNPALTELDPARGSVWSYAEGMSNFVAAGGNPDDAIIVNNYISAVPTERVMGALDRSVDALAECVHEFRSPIISGKDSLSSTYVYEDGTVLESPYNLIITVAGKIPDVEKTTSTDIKQPGSTLVMIGQPDYESMGGSVYYDNFEGASSQVPRINLPLFHKTCSALHGAIQTGKVLAAHDVSEGGIAVTVSEMLFGGDCGADLKFEDTNHAVEDIFFNETAGCFVVEVADAQTAEDLFGDVPHQIIGTTKVEKQLQVTHGDTQLPDVDIDRLKQAWRQPLQRVFA